jgi:glycosyltransferase involved in cell wall biosynthesis
MAKQSLEEIEQLLKPIALAPLCENPLISVLTASCNYARYLGKAIESVLGQTYTNFEMIICDDGSTDDSCEVVERFARRDARVRLVAKQNGGQASAWNAAYRESKGQIICFLDADDRFLPQKLETVVQAFRCNPDSGFAGDRMIRIDAAGRRDCTASSTADPPSGWYGAAIVRYGATPCGLPAGSAMCLRREICHSIFPMPEGFWICADGVVMSLAPLMTPVIGIPAQLTEYRYHGRNLINSRRIRNEAPGGTSQIGPMGWELTREYLGKVNSVLVETFPSYDKCRGTLLGAYVQGRLQGWGGALSAYRRLLRAENFLTFRVAARWFWRLSILLPRPVFRYALSPNLLKQLFWWTVEARRRIFASSAPVRRAPNRTGSD